MRYPTQYRSLILHKTTSHSALLSRLIGICLIAALSFPANLAAYEYKITVPSESRKIQDHYVHCIYKDTEGFIWLGTGWTVERLEGTKSKVYSFEGNLTSYAPYLVNAILETEPHHFWVGNNQGLWKLSHSTHTLRRAFQEQINFPVHALAKDKNNCMYIGTVKGIYTYKNRTLHFIPVNSQSTDYTDNCVRSIVPDSTGAIWFLTPQNIGIYETKSGTVKLYKNTLKGCGQFNCMARYGNLLYIGTEQKGVVTFDLSNYQFAPYATNIQAEVTALTQENGLLGIATAGEGICLYSLKDNRKIYSASYDTNTQKGLLSNNISSILLSDENIWCGTGYYLGFNLLLNTENPVRLYKTKDFTSKDLTVRSCLTSGNNVFIGTREGFYFTGENKTTQHFNINNSQGMLRSNLIFSFFQDENELFVGTCKGGISVLDIQQAHFKKHILSEKFRSNDIFMFQSDSESDLWISASDGLYCYDKTTGNIKEYNTANSGIPGNIVYCTYTDSSGRFWVGTEKGVSLFDKKTGKGGFQNIPDELLSIKTIRYIHEGRDGTLFFFTISEDLLYVADKNLKSGRLISDLKCFNVIQDNEGNYYMGSRLGIIKCNEKLDKFQLLPLNILTNALTAASDGAFPAKSADNRIYMPTMKGLAIINPNVPPISSDRIQITDIIINGDQEIDNYIIHSDTIHSFDAAENNLTFRFMSVDYTDPALSRFQYRLAGKDSTWHLLDGKDEVSYFNLPGGKYTFQVRKAFENDSAAQITFRIKHSRQWITWLLTGTAMLAVVFLIYMKNRKQVQTAPLPETENETPESKDSTSDNYANFTEDELQRLTAELKNYMETEKPYLNVDLRQSDIAAGIHCSSYELSYIFTHYLQMGYYDFISSYRIEEFKQAVARGEHNKYTLVTLAEKCGFKSKTSFFRTFKKMTGLTPKEYIQQSDNA